LVNWTGGAASWMTYQPGSAFWTAGGWTALMEADMTSLHVDVGFYANSPPTDVGCHFSRS
jgi:hypothetical protein